MKKRVAVFFGGRSPEHDVSVVTGLQVLKAVDQQRFTSFPLYITMAGDWLVGDSLRNQDNYIPRGSILENLESVTLDIRPDVEGRGRLVPNRRMFSKQKPFEFDVALLAFHGLNGEDGRIQGLLELANIPYTGMRTLASSVCMDKVATKRLLSHTDIGLLPSGVLHRPASGFIPTTADIVKQIADIHFPVIVKPVHLGSSIGVAKASNVDELRGALPPIFKLDTDAIVEPFVPNMVEYNVAVRSVDGVPYLSAIERPKSHEDLLTFKSKYRSAKDGKIGKTPGTHSEGMLSLTRDISPELPPEINSKIQRWARMCFSLMNGTGTPRIDFLSDTKSGELWLNEVNPCPGSFAFFLWEKAPSPILFTDLLSFLIDEAFSHQQGIQLPPDPTDPESRLFPHQ